MGGGGFTSWNGVTALDRFILSQARSPRPAICFLPTATGDPEGYIARFTEVFAACDCTPTSLSLFRPHTADLRSFLLAQDVVYVGGGNTKSMLALWREWGVDHILREAYEQGTVLAGRSAGMICWFEQGITDSIPGPLTALSCLGWLEGTACPHYDGEPERRPRFHQMLASGELKPGLAADDGAALYFINEQFVEVVSEREGAQGYRLERAADGTVVETSIPARQLA
jgi:peptidase E